MLSKNGFLYIFHIAEGDIRGKISVIADSKDLVIDPSGLFFAVSTPKQTIQVYEVGTGRRVYEFGPNFDVVGPFSFT